MSTLKVNTIADPDNGNTAITIDSSGNATFAQNLSITGSLSGDGSNLTGISGSSDAFWVRSTSGQAPVATNTYVKLNFDAEQIDNGSNYDTSTSKYTVPTTGHYLVGAKIWYDNYSQNALDAEVHIRLNGANTNIWSITSHVGSSGYTGLHTSGIVYATAGDYLEAYAWHNHGVDVTVMVNSSFFGYKIY